jgi:hypothetical protein
MRWRAELTYLLPVLLLNPILYWHGYNCWFQQDDFAWLGLLQMWNAGYDLPRLLFEPMAQGTVRPISERGFFLLFRWLFDLNGAPYHLLVLLTQTANLALLYALVRRLAGSSVAAGLAALLWCSNNVIAWPLSWVSAYNQILISFCFLAGLSAFIRYGDTGRKVWLGLVWLIFLLGFGVLELNVVFPALLLIYALLWARHTLKAIAWLFAPGIAFAALHVLLVRKPSTGVYTIHLGLHVPSTLARYWAMAVWPAEMREFTGLPQGLVVIPALAVAAAIAWRLWKRDRLAAFGIGWFLATLSIYLVLPQHVSEYYLTVPAIGLAITLASSLTAAPLPLAAAMLLLLLPVSWLSTWRFTQRARYRTTAWESIMDGVAQIAARHPGKAIYLEGIGTDLFIQGFTDNPFRLIGLSNVKLTPHEAASIDTHGWIASMSPFTVPAEAALHALDSGAAFVFRFEGDRFRHTTPSYRTRLAASELASAAPTRVELGNTMYDYLLGPGWFEPSDGYRWMGRSARATLGGSGRHLHVRGFCAPAQLAAGPLHLAVRPESAPAAVNFTIESCSGSFDFVAPLPAELSGRPRFGLTLEVDRAAAVPPDTRELGLAIETLEVL